MPTIPAPSTPCPELTIGAPCSLLHEAPTTMHHAFEPSRAIVENYVRQNPRPAVTLPATRVLLRSAATLRGTNRRRRFPSGRVPPRERRGHHQLDQQRPALLREYQATSPGGVENQRWPPFPATPRATPQ